MKLEFHPLANLFPLIEGVEFDDLVADVSMHGLHDTIDVFEGKILDGRNRYLAAEAAGIEIERRNVRQFHTELYGDPLAYVISKNLKRRHLDESQRAMVAARLANMRQGERTDLKPSEPSANLPKVDQPSAAKTLSISERALRYARRVQDHGEPDLVRAVDRGHLAVSIAERASRLAPEVQRRIAAEAEANPNGARNIIKSEARDVRERDLGQRQRAMPNKRYGLIYVDIPRHFNVHSDETGLDRSPENHYPTMSFDETLALPVPSIAADDCILVFWSTAASLIDDLDIIAEWGFLTLRPRAPDGKLLRDPEALMLHQAAGRYCSMQVWDKVNMGLGYWFRDRHEFIIVAARGEVVPPAPGTQDQSLFSELKGPHSSKPDRTLLMIERLWPTLPKIELFRRGPARPGWDAWGNQAEPTREAAE